MSKKDKAENYGINHEDSSDQHDKYIGKTGVYQPNDSEETSVYQSADFDKTGLYSTSESESREYCQGIKIDDIISFKDIEYSVIGIISEGTGEANVYKLQDVDGNAYALKLYYEFRFASEEPNGVALERIMKIDDPDILKLIDYGIGANKYMRKYCYEISEYARGGNLLDVEDFVSKYTYEFLKKEVIPQIFLAIKKLHEYKIYHCDIKPSNILYNDIEQIDLILGDYGSSKAYDLESEKGLRKSSTIKGTEFYLPPEQARGIVSDKNDYYSMGMVLLHLLYPEYICSSTDYSKIDKIKFEKIIERQYSQRQIVEYKPEYDDINKLIEGLTQLNHLMRWGQNEIERWLKGENIKISTSRVSYEEIKPVKFGKIVISNATELIDFIKNHSTWFEDMFEDQDVFRIVIAWLDSYIGIPDRKRFEKIVLFYQSLGKSILKEAINLYFFPEDAAKDTYLYNTDDIAVSTANYIKKLDSIYRDISIDELAVQLLRLEYILKNIYYLNNNHQVTGLIITKIALGFDIKIDLHENFNYECEISKYIKKIKDKEKVYISFICLAYEFDENRSYYQNIKKPITTAEDLALFYIGNQDLFEDEFHIYERKALLKRLNCESLASLNLEDLCIELLVSKADVLIEINQISFVDICTVHYSIVTALDSYLKNNNIEDVLVLDRTEGGIYSGKNTGSTKKAVNGFLVFLKNKHKLLEDQVVEATVRDFAKAHRKYFRINNIVSRVAIILIFALTIFIVYKII